MSWQGVTLQALVAELGGRLLGDPGCRVHRFRPLVSAGAGDLSFLANSKYRHDAQATAASAVIVAPDQATLWDGRSESAASDSLVKGAGVIPARIITDDPYLYFARAAQWFERLQRSERPAQVHPTAVVDVSARIGQGVSIGPYAVVGARCHIGDGVRLGAHVVLGDDVVVGDAACLYPQVVVYDGCQVGARTILHAGVVIGADGFGFAPGPDGYAKIPQVGRALLGDDVEIGANTTVDRGALDDTVVGRGVKLDNLIQIGHNVTIGEHTVIAAHSAVAGSAKIGPRVMVGGCAGIAGHTEVAAGVVVGPMSMVSKSLKNPGKYVGAFPIDEERAWLKNAAALRQLADLRDRLRQLEQTVAGALTEPEQHADGRS